MKKLFIILLMLLLTTNSYGALTDKYADCGVGGEAGDGEIGNPWGTLHDAFNEVEDGERINVVNSTVCTLASTITISTSGTIQNGGIALRGYKTTIDDGFKTEIDGDGAALYIFDVNGLYNIIEDVEVYGSTDDAFYINSTGDNVILKDIKITTAGDFGIYVSSGGTNATFVGLEITGTQDDGINSEGVILALVGSYIHDIPGLIGVYYASINHMYGNVFDTMLTGFNPNGDDSGVINNTFYNMSGDAMVFRASSGENILINNIMNTMGDYCLDASAGGIVSLYLNNNCEGETTGHVNLDQPYIFFEEGTQNDVDPQLVDPANGTVALNDFNIGANLDNLGYPIALPGIPLTTGNVEPGCCMYEETAGAGAGGQKSYGFSR